MLQNLDARLTDLANNTPPKGGPPGGPRHRWR
jgi:hypothetical protein